MGTRRLTRASPLLNVDDSLRRAQAQRTGFVLRFGDYNGGLEYNGGLQHETWETLPPARSLRS